MLKKIKSARQIEGEPYRVWYADDAMDVIVWTSESSEVIGFQIDHKTGGGEQALTWDKEAGFGHYWIDDGENRPGRAKMTPILVGGGRVDIPALRSRFLALATELPEHVVRFIDRRLSGIGQDHPSGTMGGDQP